MSQINFFKIDNNYVGFRGNREILHELRSKYSFHTKNYKWDKRYKLGYWDGKISMLNLKDMRMYAGLLPEVKRYLEEEAIPYTDSSGIAAVNDWSEDDVLNLYKEIKGPFVPREDQVDAVLRCINEGRNIVLAPTSNGKSYIIHGINSYYRKNNLRVLIVIHRANLVMQLKDNFVNEYGAAYTVSTIYDDNNYLITLENNEPLLLNGNESVKLINNKNKKVRELTIDDEIDDRWLQSNYSK